MAHRRRGVGVGRQGASKYVQKKADELKASSLQSAIDTVEKLEIKLTEFAKTHRNKIQKDPVVRARFLQMCAPLGIDPLSSKKTVLGNLLGMGDFYHELAVKIAEVCLASKSSNGGIMSVREIQNTLKQRKSKFGMVSAQDSSVSEADIRVAISKLGQLGGGFRIVEIGKSPMVVSVPTELDNDHVSVLNAAQERAGQGIALQHVTASTGWHPDRAQRAMDLLLHEGMAWIDYYQGETYYWFSSIWQEQR
jgi:ESCRT-II complex subunit VPS22